MYERPGRMAWGLRHPYDHVQIAMGLRVTGPVLQHTLLYVQRSRTCILWRCYPIDSGLVISVHYHV